VLLFSGLYDLETVLTRKFVAIRSDIEMFLGTMNIEEYQHVEAYSVLKNMTEAYPPTFISSGEVDGLHPESVELIKVLEKNQIYHDALLYDKKEKKAFHSYHMWLDLYTAQQCMERVGIFLKKVTNEN
jgi:acetyl esterase/lipase